MGSQKAAGDDAGKLASIQQRDRIPHLHEKPGKGRFPRPIRRVKPHHRQFRRSQLQRCYKSTRTIAITSSITRTCCSTSDKDVFEKGPLGDRVRPVGVDGALSPDEQGVDERSEDQDRGQLLQIKEQVGVQYAQ